MKNNAKTYRLPETTTPEIRLTAVSEEMFEDNGHALAWGMAQ